MKNENHEDISLIYELLQNNPLLKSELEKIRDTHKHLLLQLEHATQEIATLRLRSKQDRRKIDMPYSGPDRRQFNLSATQH